MARDKRHSNRQNRNKPPRISDKISEHFSKKDFVCRECEDKEKCSKSFKISLGLVGGLELLRAKLNKRINIVKGYSCPNAAEKASKIRRNYYAIGVAASIQVEDVDIQDVFLAAEEIPEFKGIGLNITNNTVHVDTRKTDERALWIEEETRFIDLTDENRSKFIKVVSEV